MNWTAMTAEGPSLLEHAPEAEECLRALDILACPGAVTELRALPGGVCVRREGSDLEGLVCDVARIAPGASGIYYALNPLPLGLDRPARDGDVLRRRWLLIDVDPIKDQAHKDDMPTEAERLAAVRTAELVRDSLDVLGWPAPLEIDSGGGAHLLYRVDLPNDDASKLAIKGLLKRLAALHPGVDPRNYNASRIAKLPGTWARKGRDMPDRPWRMARIVRVPDRLACAAMGQIESAFQDSTDTVVESLAATPGHWLRLFAEPETPERDPYAEGAMARELSDLLAAPGGGRNNQLNQSAFALGTLVGAGRLAEADVSSRLSSAARGVGLPEAEAERTIRSGMDAGKLKPRPREDRPSGQSAQVGTTPATARPAVTYRADELLGMTLPEPKWVVPGLLSEGMTILAGKPKLGKSWLALGLGLTVAYGGKALGNIQTAPGDVLYLSLEDRLRRVQDRTRKVLAGLGHDAPSRLHIAVEWPRQGRGGVEAVEEWAAAQARPVLVIIDVLTRFKLAQPARGSAYEQDYLAVGEIKERMDRIGVSTVAVHHCKKAAEEDAYDEISGTNGIGGAADGAMILSRARVGGAEGGDDAAASVEGTLFITGRDVPESKMAVSFDPRTFCWTAQGAAGARVESLLGKGVIALLKANRPTALSPSDVASQLGSDPHYTRTVLGRLATKGVIERVGSSKYRYPLEASDDSPF